MCVTASSLYAALFGSSGVRSPQHHRGGDQQAPGPGYGKRLLRASAPAFAGDELADEAVGAREKLAHLLDCAPKALPDDREDRKEQGKRIVHGFILSGRGFDKDDALVVYHQGN